MATTFRQLNKATASHLSGPQHVTVRLSEPVPPHAFAAHWLAPGAAKGLTLKRRKKLVRLVAASGVLPNMEVALQAADFVGALRAAFEEAAGAGHLPVCQWLRDLSVRTADAHDALRADEAMQAAAGGGHQHVCEWLLPIHPRALRGPDIRAAASKGHLDLAEWLIQQHPACGGEGYLFGVAYGCDLPTLQRAWPRFRRPHTGMYLRLWEEGLLCEAAGSPTPDWAAKVKWLEAQGCPLNSQAVWEAAYLPDDGEALARLTWLRGRGYSASRDAVSAAACAGNTAALQYLLTEVAAPAVVAPSGQRDPVISAARSGNLAALQALLAAGWPMRASDVAPKAARAGHLHVLAWLLDEHGAEPAGQLLNQALFSAAAASGSLEVLGWLRQRGCPWGCGAYSGAAEAGCEAALEWLVEQGCPMEESGQPYMKASCNGDMATLRCLRRLGVPWGPTGQVFLGAATSRPDPVPLGQLRWLLQHGCPVEYEAAEERLSVSRGVRSQWANEVLQLLAEHQRRPQ
ncbi:hypothetical protein GPECTOR_3g339 [Gonium pectorale]|uniref:Ankyrin repeat domain-containing protein n=1 Tax=Gonium pectorale TaxID=33097 RepID=A0A150GZI7_GONPE|nr:hypothetical protein GPECTOR_3g339 [Gonium pectorale]|eukprot:KXZ55194.1 hypothetical protein GPECTOR_3g339 [Gonium pectorale]